MMKSLLTLGVAVGLGLSFATAASADSIRVLCQAPGQPAGVGQFITCDVNLNGSLADTCSCPANLVLIDPTNFPPSNEPGTPPPLPPRASPA